jgi:hypothetical protein
MVSSRLLSVRANNTDRSAGGLGTICIISFFDSPAPDNHHFIVELMMHPKGAAGALREVVLVRCGSDGTIALI